MTNNIEILRANQPLVICYTNDVVKNFTANGLLSLGASPAMSEAPEEATDMLNAAHALLINIGTLTKAKEEDIMTIAKTANKVGTPVVFDPVAVGASQYRKAFCHRFLQEVDIAVIKGNASEILTLVHNDTTMKGTDGDVTLNPVEIAKLAHEYLKTTIVVTGKEDVIIQDNKIIKSANGSPMLTKVTGAGCLLGGVIASFLPSQKDQAREAIIEAVTLYNIAAEQAEAVAHHKGPGTFMIELLNALYHISFDDYLTYRRIQEV